MSLFAKSYISQYMVSEGMAPVQAKESAAQLAKAMESNELTLLQFIQLLGDHLTDDSNVVRSKAIGCLTGTLEVLSRNKLSKKDISVIVDFYVSKLSDESCQRETLKGIKTLVSMDNFASPDIKKVLKQLKKDYDPKKHLASVRFLAFDLLLEMITKFPSFVGQFNETIIKLYLQISQNEKDPKNLLISFKLNAKISTNFEISGYEEDLFDAAFCYFPISFNAPENDPYKITGDQLKQELRKVLSSNSLFAKDSFPNLIEKLAATSPTVKLDTLATIDLCVRSYDAETVEGYWLSLWNSLKFEILHNELASAEDLDSLFKYYENAENEDERVIPMVLKIFQSLSSKFVGQENSSLEDYITIVIDELSKYLSKVDDKKFKQSAVILAAIASTNPQVFNLVVSKAFPHLLAFNQSSDPVTIAQQRKIITNISFFLDSYQKLFSNTSDTNSQVIDTPLPAFKDDILGILNTSLLTSSNSEVSLRCLAIKNMSKIISMPQYLATSERELVLQTLTETVLEEDNQVTFKEGVHALSSISGSLPSIVLSIAIPKFMAYLPDSDVSSTTDIASSVKKTKEEILELLVVIANNKQIVDTLTIRLLSKIEVLLQSPDASQGYVRTLILTLSKLLKKLDEFESTVSHNDYIKKFVPRLMTVILQNTVFKSSVIFNDTIALVYTGRIMKTIIANVDLNLHQSILNDVCDIFIKGSQENELLLDQLSGPIKVFEGTYVLYSLFSEILSIVDKSTTLPISVYEITDSLIASLPKVDRLSERQYALQTLSIIVNKWFDFSKEESYLYLRKKVDGWKSELESDDNLERIMLLENITWITKALLLQGNEYATELQEFLFDLLKNPSYTRVAPKVLEIVVADTECFEPYKKVMKIGIINKSVVFNINIRMLYKQKFFDSILPKLIENFSDPELANYQKNYLIALSLVLKYIEKSIILPHLQVILPLILESLTVKSNTIRSSSLSILDIAISDTPDLIARQLQTIIPNLLELLKDSNQPSEEVRCKSLKCLMDLTMYVSLIAMMPYRSGVINNLVEVIDDPKRLVRKLACDCRQLYYELGQPRAED